MQPKEEVLNVLLVELFNNITNIEEKALRTESFENLSMTEFHVIAAIGVGNPLKMSDIAPKLGVTVGTLTIAVNNLLKKGYVARHRSETDRRVVYISLTESGVRAYNHHESFHKEMIDFTLKALTEAESEVLAKALLKVIKYFKERYETRIEQ